MRKSGTQAATETGNGGVLFTRLLLQTFSAYSPTQGGTTYSGLGSPIPIISKKMPPACLQASQVEADVLFCFVFSQLKFPLFRRSYLKKWPAQSFTSGENIRAGPLGARAISYSYVSANIHHVPTMSHAVI